MFKRITDRISNVIKEMIDAIWQRIDPMVAIIALLAVSVAVSGLFIYFDPNGKITGRPDTVAHFVAYDATYDSVSLKWEATPRAEKYNVYRSEDKYTGYEKVKTVTGTEYTDKDLMTGTEYWYKVKACSDRRKGSSSKKVSIKPKLQTPEITARSTGDGVLIKISEVPGASGYTIYRDGKIVAKGDGREYLDDDTKSRASRKYTALAYRELDDKVVKSPKSRARVSSKATLNISLDNYEEIPELVTGDDSFQIKGDVKSNATIDRIEVGVVGKDSDEWVSNNTKYEESEINDKDFDIQNVNEKIAMDSLPAGQYKFVVKAELKDGTVRTLKDQEFTVREPKGGELIVKTALECAWPYGTPLGKYRYAGGSPTQAYREALTKAYGSRSSWGAQTRAGASCDVFTGTVVRASGVDTEFPRGLDGFVSHYKKNTDKWDLIEDHSEANLMPGDVIFQNYNGNGGHICIYVGDGKVAEAHFGAHGGTYGVVSSYKGSVVSESRCHQYYVIRSRL